MNKDEKYKVQSHTFLGEQSYEGEVYGYKYEITFNKSLMHTGKFSGIEDGLNQYDKKEAMENFKHSLIDVWKTFIRMIKSIFK